VSQPRISDLERGKIGEFTIDSLVEHCWATPESGST
jgi:predicted XRE-type DNA-binding protein